MGPIFFNEIQEIISTCKSTEKLDHTFSDVQYATLLLKDSTSNNIKNISHISPIPKSILGVIPKVYPQKLASKLIDLIYTTFVTHLEIQSCSLKIPNGISVSLREDQKSRTKDEKCILHLSIEFTINSIAIEHLNKNHTKIEEPQIEIGIDFLYDEEGKYPLQYKNFSLKTPSPKIENLIKSILLSTNLTLTDDIESYSKGWINLIKNCQPKEKKMQWLKQINTEKEGSQWLLDEFKKLNIHNPPVIIKRLDSDASVNYLPSRTVIEFPLPHICPQETPSTSKTYQDSQFNLFIQSQLTKKKNYEYQLTQHVNGMPMNLYIIQNPSEYLEDFRETVGFITQIPYLKQAIQARSFFLDVHTCCLKEDFALLNYHLNPLLQFLNTIFNTTQFTSKSLCEPSINTVQGTLTVGANNNAIKTHKNTLLQFYNNPTLQNAKLMVVAVKSLVILEGYEKLSILLQKTFTDQWSQEDFKDFYATMRTSFGINLDPPDFNGPLPTKTHDGKKSYLEQCIETMGECLGGGYFILQKTIQETIQTSLESHTKTQSVTPVIQTLKRTSQENFKTLLKAKEILSQPDTPSQEDSEILLRSLDILYGVPKKIEPEGKVPMQFKDVRYFFEQLKPLPYKFVAMIRKFLKP